MPGVAEVRRRGFMVGIELAGFSVADRAGHQVTLAARRRGAIVRPLGDVVVLMPPLAITPRELRRLVTIVADSIAEVCAAAEAPARLAA
jgi:adenosylmethionine-8-amino-7-oxononanoate aminotransferase